MLIQVNKITKILLVAGYILLASCGGGGGGGVSPPSQIPEGELSISGTISVSAAAIVDLDTNDPDAPPNSGPDNDFPYDGPGTTTTNYYSAQLIPNPGIVGGFVARPGAGPAGAVTKYGDEFDTYRVSLVPGQTISLLIADHIENNPLAVDLDLFLFDLDVKLVDLAAGFGAVETLTVAEGGEYFVLVTTCVHINELGTTICGNGASNYILSVGQSEALTGLRLSSDFVTGEALVRYKETVNLTSEADTGAYSASVSALADTSTQVGDVHLVRFETETDGFLTAQATATGSLKTAPAGFPMQVPAELQDKLATLAQLKKLARNDNVERVEPNYIRQPMFTSDDPGYPHQWHYPLINLPAAWDLGEQTGFLGDRVSVAVLDTGILPFHPDLQNQIDLISPGYDFISSAANALDGDGVDSNPTDPGYGSSFHGSHVAGTIAAETANGIGVAGVAPAATITPIRVLGQFGGSTLDIRQGLCFAAGLSAAPNCTGVPVNDNPADVINMSLGGETASVFEEELVAEVLASGVVIVAAAGNSSSDRPLYPAAYPGVIGVSAVTIERKLAPYSSYGSFVDVTAPGGDISTDINGDGYDDGVLSTGGRVSFGTQVEYNYPFFQGTSMATPHVAGVVALMRSANESLDADAISAMLAAGELTQPLGELINGRNDEFGYGLIDAHKALSAALTADGSPPAPNPWLGVTPAQLNFGSTLDSLGITLRNNSGGDLNVLNITSDVSWLVAPGVSGLGDYTVRVDRSGLPEGSYSGTLTIESDVNTVNISVIMQKLDSIQTGSVGHLYVRVIDPLTGDIREVETDVSDGEYIWQIDNLPPGDYQLVAFTDADNDGGVCDPGEACGSYLTADQPILIELLDADIFGLNYHVNFGVALSDPDDTPKNP